MEYHAAIKQNEIMPSAVTWMDAEIIILKVLLYNTGNYIQYPIISYNEVKR